MRIRLSLLSILAMLACAPRAVVAGEGFVLTSIERPWAMKLFEPTIELIGTEQSDSTKLYAIPGMHWRTRDRMELGIGFAKGLSEGSGRFTVLAVFSFEF